MTRVLVVPKLGALLAMGLLGRGCDPDPSPEPAQDCDAIAPADLASLPPRVVELGELDGDSFRAYALGDSVTMVTGFQGFSMFTPYLELPASEADGDAPCWWVQLELVDDEYEDLAQQGGLVFERVGEVMRAGPIFAIPNDVGPVLLRLTVAGEDFVAVDEVEVEVPNL